MNSSHKANAIRFSKDTYDNSSISNRTINHNENSFESKIGKPKLQIRIPGIFRMLIAKMTSEPKETINRPKINVSRRIFSCYKKKRRYEIIVRHSNHNSISNRSSFINLESFIGKDDQLAIANSELKEKGEDASLNNSTYCLNAKYNKSRR